MISRCDVIDREPIQPPILISSALADETTSTFLNNAGVSAGTDFKYIQRREGK